MDERRSAKGDCDNRDDLVIAVGKLRYRWIIGPAHDRAFAKKVLLPWALPDARLLRPESEADVIVGVYLRYARVDQIRAFYESRGVRFVLCGDPKDRNPVGNGVYGFFQGPKPGDDPQWARYCPVMCIWAPPMNSAKTKPLSAIEGKKRPWRIAAAKELGRKVGAFDGFGAGFGRPLGGYHVATKSPNVFEKYLGLTEYGFHFAQERVAVPDYLTEKFADPILCECVPVYSGCPNILDYAVPESFVRCDEAERIDWKNWRFEYGRRRRFVQYQKHLIRTTFNYLSYFVRIAESPELLDKKRPLTLNEA